MIIKKAYGALGLQQGASVKSVKRAHRRLTKELHPDLNPAPEARTRFMEIQNAYEVLMRTRGQSSDEQLLRETRYGNTRTARGQWEQRDYDGGAKSGYESDFARFQSSFRGLVDAIMFTWPLWVGYYLIRRNRSAAVEVDVDSDGKAYLVNRQGMHERAPHYDDL